MAEPHPVKENTEPQIHVTDGMSQGARHLPPLQKDYFNVDERRFEQLLTQMQDYSRLVKTPGIAYPGQTAATELFADDEIVIMAQILSIDLASLDHHFERRLQQDLANTDWVLQEPKRTSLLGLAQLLDSWLTLLRYPQSSAGENLYSMIESVTIGFGKEFSPLIQQAGLLDQLPPLFSPAFITLIRRKSSPADSSTTTSSSESVEPNGVVEKKFVYASLLKSIEMIQQAARKFLPQSMLAENHDPAAGLRIAFVSIYQKLQHKLNNFTLAYIDFYFNDVLKAKERPLSPDSVYLIVQPNTQNKIIELPKGTEFLAGIDTYSQDIIYRSDAAAEINDIQVASLHTLYFPRNSIEEIGAKKWVDACRLNSIPVQSANSKPVHQSIAYHPLFGEPRSQLDTDSAVDARLGFALASNLFSMCEGAREVTVHLKYANIIGDDNSTLEEKIEQLSVLKQTEQDKENVARGVFFAYFGSIFKLSLTVADGWFDIPEYKPAYEATDHSLDKNCLGIHFSLPQDCPPITPFTAQVHGEGQPTSVPVLRFLLKHNHLQYPYDLLKKFVLKEIRIEVKVKGCRDLIVYNDLGQLSPVTPFAPFGPLPAVGSYFIVGCKETRAKQLTSFDVNIEWKGLPDLSTGFDGWYEGYSTPKPTEHFVVSTSVLAEGVWQPRDTGYSQQPLFSTHLGGGRKRLKSQKQLSTSSVIGYYKPQDAEQVRKPFAYVPSTRSGLFKFVLQAPSGGFGHVEYQALLANTLTFNARVKHSQFFKPLPNAPYTPEIAAISINYSAASTLVLGDSERQKNSEFKDQFFHLHPLGWEKISPLLHPMVFQVPQYNDDGNLYIGLKGGQVQQLSLLFHFHNDSLPMQLPADTHNKYFHKIEAAQARLSWSYLSNNQWRVLEPRKILADSTQGFMRSGIVTLDLSHELTVNNTLLPRDLYWLRISANDQLKNFSHLYSVYTQALCATWSSGQHPASNPPMVLPPGSITRPRHTIPGIAGAAQICPSFGGIPAETVGQLRTRMSERLRHKNRALTPRDYELLILEKFPQIYKVKCFANTSLRAEKSPSPGNLLIVPIPYLTESRPNFYKPHFDGYLIFCIKEFIKNLTSPFVNIEIENPVYEEIQVRCAVQLKKDRHAGHYQNLLNKALCDFISPWVSLGNQVHFGWSINARDIKSFIHNLDYVDFVTDFSLLRIAPRSSGLFVLEDTANDEPIKTAPLKPSYLWSTAVPIQNHYIVTAESNEPFDAQVTGYDELEVGSNFIISR